MSLPYQPETVLDLDFEVVPFTVAAEDAAREYLERAPGLGRSLFDTIMFAFCRAHEESRARLTDVCRWIIELEEMVSSLSWDFDIDVFEKYLETCMTSLTSTADTIDQTIKIMYEEVEDDMLAIWGGSIIRPFLKRFAEIAIASDCEQIRGAGRVVMILVTPSPHAECPILVFTEELALDIIAVIQNAEAAISSRC